MVTSTHYNDTWWTITEYNDTWKQVLSITILVRQVLSITILGREVLSITILELRTDSFCEYESLNISCELSHIKVINATFGREGNKCGSSTRTSCPVTDVTAAVTRKCDDSLVCRFEIDDDFFGIINDKCGHKKRLTVTYDCYGNINQIGSWDVALANCSSSGRNLTSINELNSSEINDEKGTWLRERWQYTDFYWIEDKGTLNIKGERDYNKNCVYILNVNSKIYELYEDCESKNVDGYICMKCEYTGSVIHCLLVKLAVITLDQLLHLG
ncbi:hypothetical protein KUTeg_019136 [Tegillarca granosa]|uniref:SUEL-type lectin domain-containing protein n=1 Tax=Tegillarca granosa TaxID=220873 RepID=A0ABQ9EGS9_TEGGR|nr:hypothetical protein KUTeg_019136 [Tegillarca granosa]